MLQKLQKLQAEVGGVGRVVLYLAKRRRPVVL